MATILTELKERFRMAGMAMRLVYINAGVFVLVSLASIALILFNRSPDGVVLWAELPAWLPRLIRQPWSVVTYMFLHTGLLHILFNMLWLYWFGMLFLQFFSARHLRGLYVLGGLCGGALYVLSFNVFPYFAAILPGAHMLGASASVLAIVAAVAYREPDYPIRLLLFGTVRLKWLALAVIGLDLLSFTGTNGGGHIAHVGGALAGLWFAAALRHGTDVTAWLNFLMDLPSKFFRPRPRKPKMRVKAGGGRAADYDHNARRKAQDEEIDRILDKLKKSGYTNLTAEEKQKLFDASRR